MNNDAQEGDGNTHRHSAKEAGSVSSSGVQTYKGETQSHANAQEHRLQRERDAAVRLVRLSTINRRHHARLWRRLPFVGLIHSTAVGWRPSACSRTMRLDGSTLLLLLLHLLLPLPPDWLHVIGQSRVRPCSLASGIFAFRGEGALIWAGPVVLLSSASCAFLERRPASLLLQVDQAVSPLVGYSPLVEGGAPNAQTARPPVRHYGDMTCRASHCAMHVTCSL